MLLQIICGPAAGLVSSLIVHLVFRALAAIGCAAAFTAGFVICKRTIFIIVLFKPFERISKKMSYCKIFDVRLPICPFYCRQ